MATEADTCRTLVTPKLQAAGWESDPPSIAEQRSFTDGRTVVHRNNAKRRKGKQADYLLRYNGEQLRGGKDDERAHFLKLPPISHHGNVNKIIGKFGGTDQLHTAINQLQSLLYAA